MDGKKPSGAEFRKRRKQEAQQAAARERDRSGATNDERALLKRVGEPGLDPLKNQEWANNAAAAMAFITLNDETIPRETRFKQTADFIDRIASTRSPASTAKHIRELKKKAGMVDEPVSKSNAVVSVGAGRTLRAR